MVGEGTYSSGECGGLLTITLDTPMRGTSTKVLAVQDKPERWQEGWSLGAGMFWDCRQVEGPSGSRVTIGAELPPSQTMVHPQQTLGHLRQSNIRH